MASEVQTYVIQHKMEKTEKHYKERRWMEKTDKKGLKNPSYQPSKGQDISFHTSLEERNNNNNKSDDDDDDVDDNKSSSSNSSSSSSSISTASSRSNSISYSSNSNNIKRSTVELKIEKKVELIEDRGGELTLSPLPVKGPAISFVYDTEICDDILLRHHSRYIETDNRVSVKEVETAVIETDTINDNGVVLSCDMTDVGPEIKRKIALETDIDTSVDIADTANERGDVTDVGNDTGDYKVVGNDAVAFEMTAGPQMTATEELQSPTNDTYKYIEMNNNKVMISQWLDGTTASREESVQDNDKQTSVDVLVNSTTTTCIEEDSKKRGNRIIEKESVGNRKRLDSNRLEMIVENGETEQEIDVADILDAQTGTSMTDLEINEHKNATQTDDTKTEKSKKTVIVTENLKETEMKTTIKTETLTVTETHGTEGEGTDVALREVRGRDAKKVKRDLKLDIPNNNNNSDKTAVLDQLLLSSDMSQGIGVCCRCGEGFGTHQQIVNSNGEVWHPQCFVCAQCFQPFPEGIFYEFEGRKYCEHDFHVLFAPCCGKCGEFIVGRVIKAMNNAWHPDCFRCQLCNGPLADSGFVKNAGRALCRECNAKEKARGMGKYVCHKCHSIIEEGHIKYKGEAYHPYHFNCNNCGIELNADAREVNGELYCLRCHDKMGIPICGACRRPIEERVVHALGKAWHVEHFVCAKCEKPFFGTRHYEKKGLAYCEVHYHQLFGNICFVCNSVISGDVFHAFNKAWHVNHFACSICDRKMSQKTKFFEFDLKPVCKFCYEKFPGELKKRLKKAYEEQGTKK